MDKFKAMFRIRLWGLIIGLFVAGNAPAQTDTLSFLHITDTHVIFNLETYHPGIASGRQHYGQGIVPLKQFLQTMPGKLNSDFVVITGDLVDFYEAETAKGGMLDLQAEQFTRLIGNSPVPVFLTLGNHDLAVYSWQNGKRISSQHVAVRSRATWIRNAGCFKEGTYYSRTYTVGGTTYRLIFLEDGYEDFHPDEKSGIPYLDKAQLYWLETELQQLPDDIEIILMHIPLSVRSVQPGSSSELYSVLEKNPSVKLILAGHNHKNDVTEYNRAENQKMIQVQTGAFGRDADNNWRLVRLTKDQIMISLPGKTENELVIQTK
ncbi:MAG: metallophosphoesterase family protein [Mangrovibacterium sp.]